MNLLPSSEEIRNLPIFCYLRMGQGDKPQQLIKVLLLQSNKKPRIKKVIRICHEPPREDSTKLQQMLGTTGETESNRQYRYHDWAKTWLYFVTLTTPVYIDRFTKLYYKRLIFSRSLHKV